MFLSITPRHIERIRDFSSRRYINWHFTYLLTYYAQTRTSYTLNHHPRTHIQPFSNLSALSTREWCPENLLTMSLTVKELSCWHTNRQTHTHTHKQTNNHYWRQYYPRSVGGKMHDLTACLGVVRLFCDVQSGPKSSHYIFVTSSSRPTYRFSKFFPCHTQQ